MPLYTMMVKIRARLFDMTGGGMFFGKNKSLHMLYLKMYPFPDDN